MLYFLCAVVVFLCICLICKVIAKTTSGRNGSYTCLMGKTAIVTGANRGIGFDTALDFASRGAKVILACRNKAAAEEARKNIIERTENPNVFVEILDLASLTSVRNFVQRIKSSENRLDILVNNAAVIMFEDKITEDKLSMFMQINYLAPFLLTTLLIDLLKKTKNSRIVNVSSITANLAKLNPSNLNDFCTSFISKIFYTNYGNTKLCIMLWTNELARRLKDTGITVNSLHPGLIGTGILQGGIITSACYTFADWVFFKTQEEGAQTTIYVAVSEQLRNVSGLFFKDCKVARPPQLALNTVLAKQVWKTSEDLVKLTAEEKIVLLTDTK